MLGSGYPFSLWFKRQPFRFPVDEENAHKTDGIRVKVWARLIWDFQPLGAKERAMPVDFSEELDVKPVR
jgi:hypothetical protein